MAQRALGASRMAQPRVAEGQKLSEFGSFLKRFLTKAWCHARMREADIPILTPLELANVGRVLYGAHWREGLVTALGLPDDALICAVEAGIVEAPGTWRARLIAEAQNVALRAMDAANTLLWGDHEGASPAEGELV